MAVPFLISHIGLNRTFNVDTFTKGPPVIEDEMASVRALIRIGKPASLAVMRAFQEGHIGPDDRVAALYVVSNIPDVPEARGFLHMVLAELNLERSMAEDGINRLENGR